MFINIPNVSETDDRDTVSDESHSINLSRKESSSPLSQSKIGPNINLKVFKKRYTNDEEKQFFFEKIKKKKKTELCKNYALYNDCFYKNNCSFAHGMQELRQNSSTPSYKTKICKIFQENSFCNFGQRCHYQHVIKEKRLLNFDYLLRRMCTDLAFEVSKKENHELPLSFLYKRQLSKRSLMIPRLEILSIIAPGNNE